MVYSRSSVSGLAGQAPTDRIQPGIPCPSPATTRPGNSCARVASSMAANAAFRAPAGRIPMPTTIREVTASTAPAWAIPPRKPRSSTTHKESNPSSSARRANGSTSEAGRSRGSITPTVMRPP
ncbi:hypothetical protein Acsp02_62080 [Actinoplanes sp. NBRC 103695]|nr:hypothetical protein Acsp02_62080 [Actinoplanes sp. NBRC 103695]